MTELRGSRAVVTGAGSGLGRALAHELARRGARVLVADIDAVSAEATRRALVGGPHAAFACDVARREQVEAMARAADERLGGVDVLVNNAGVAVAGDAGAVSPEDWAWIVGVNLWGVVHGCEVFAPRLREQRRGWILNVASMAGLLGVAKMGPYCATKFAVVGLSECLNAELAPSNVAVSVLCPSFFPTGIAANGRATDPRALALVEKLMARSPLDAGDVARIALDGLERRELYVLPHEDSRWFWRLKRAAPSEFARLAPKVAKWAERRFGGKPR
ncbi:MAG TPA: SDR family NAD(P)-dependent oxidoreductase [Polyangiaceae bacterium]|nr:SDR family NAD(P)-dependent oxidoreductase [Polyangiaceae bacterium]